MNDKDIINKLARLIEEGTILKNNLMSEPSSSIGSTQIRMHNRKYYQDAERWRGKCLNLLKLRFGVDSTYHLHFYQEINRRSSNEIGDYYKENVSGSLGALEWVLDALGSGLTEDLFYKKEILVLSNLLEQAYEFLDNNMDLAACIYGRIVMETTIREFANKNSINEEKFEQLIIKLRQEGFISQPLESSFRGNYLIGSWAVHGKEEFEQLNSSQKKEFLDFVRDKVLTLE